MFLTVLLQLGCGRRCILPFDLGELLFVFVGSHILHLPQLVQLTQGQAGLAQIVQSGLAVVLAYILVSFGFTAVHFVQGHTSIYYSPGTPVGAGAPGVTVGTGAAAPPASGAPASAPVSAAVSS